MNRPEFLEMHVCCVAAMQEYFAEVEKTIQMLAECGAEPLTFKERFKLMAQGIAENDAHVVYVGAKGSLYKAARLGYGFST
jgi:hypothetical protein